MLSYSYGTCHLLDKLRENGVILTTEIPTISCQVFEDNAGAIELAKLPKLRPRTKHLAIQYHHFRSWTTRGLNGEEPKIKINYVSTDQQEADIMTKPLAKYQFELLRKRLCGWWVARRVRGSVGNGLSEQPERKIFRKLRGRILPVAGTLVRRSIAWSRVDCLVTWIVTRDAMFMI